MASVLSPDLDCLALLLSATPHSSPASFCMDAKCFIVNDSVISIQEHQRNTTVAGHLCEKSTVGLCDE